jgi:hypothetical protein
MDKVQKPSDSKCFTQSSEPFKILHIHQVFHLGVQEKLRCHAITSNVHVKVATRQRVITKTEVPITINVVYIYILAYVR